MCIPDVTHKLLPGYVGGVQEGARTPAGKGFTSFTVRQHKAKKADLEGGLIVFRLCRFRH